MLKWTPTSEVRRVDSGKFNALGLKKQSLWENWVVIFRILGMKNNFLRNPFTPTILGIFSKNRLLSQKDGF